MRNHFNILDFPHFISSDSTEINNEKIKFVTEVNNFNSFLIYHSRIAEEHLGYYITYNNIKGFDVGYSIGFDENLINEYVHNLHYIKINKTDKPMKKIKDSEQIVKNIDFKIYENYLENTNMMKLSSFEDDLCMDIPSTELNYPEMLINLIPIIPKCHLDINLNSSYWFNILECMQNLQSKSELRITIIPEKINVNDKRFIFARNCIKHLEDHKIQTDIEYIQLYHDILNQQHLNRVTIDVVSTDPSRLGNAFFADQGYSNYIFEKDVLKTCPKELSSDKKDFLRNNVCALYTDEELNSLLMPPFSFGDAIPHVKNYAVRPQSIPSIESNNIIIAPDKPINKRKNMISLGYLRNEQCLMVNQNLLTEHLFITGGTGSGKSTYIKHIISSLGHNVHYMIIDPVKEEYISFANELSKNSARKKPKTISFQYNNEEEMFKINPFVIPEGIVLNSYIAFLANVFSGLMPSSLATFDYILGMIRNSYIKLFLEKYKFNALKSKWVERYLFDPVFSHEQLRADSKLYPTLKDFETYGMTWIYEMTSLKNENTVKRLSEFDINIRRYFERWFQKFEFVYPLIYKTFSLSNEKEYYKYLDSIDKEDIIITLKGVENSVEKNSLFLYFVGLLNMHRRSKGQSYTLKHMTILEEAHRIIPKDIATKNLEITDSVSQHSNELVANMLAEIRGFGESIVISEQSSKKIINDAITNTSTKIIKKINDGEDIERLGESLSLSPFERKFLPYLNKEEMLVFVSGVNQPVYLSLKIE